MNEQIALFDMDGTLVDYSGKLMEDLVKLQSPWEANDDTLDRSFNSPPDWMLARMRLIKSSIDWWANLPRLKLGFDLWEIIGDLGMHRVILTQGPQSNANAWAGKKLWIDRELGQNVDITITRDKGLVYGRVLVDDWPDYAERWLKWRPRGLVVMPASDHNKNFEHPQVIRYDGMNLYEVRETIKKKLE